MKKKYVHMLIVLAAFLAVGCAGMTSAGKPSATIQRIQKRGAVIVGTSANMPPHAHAIGVQCQSSLEASTQDGTKAAPAPDVILAKDKDSTGGVHPVLPYAEGSKKNTTIGGLKVNATASCQDTGLGEAAEIRNPYQVLSYCIATEGIFPSRS